MKHKTRLALLVSVLVLTLVSCQYVTVPIISGFETVRGSGNVVEEDREASGFSRLSLTGIGDVRIEVGETESLRIEAEDNLMEYLETKMRGDVLEIGVSDNVNLSPTEPVRFYLTVVELNAISISGSGDVHAPDLQATRFSITINGSGDIVMGALTADSLRVVINGSGDVLMSACQADDQEFVVQGSGDVQVDDLQANSVEVDILGSGSVSAGEGQADDQDITVGGSGSYEAPGLESTSAYVRIGGSGNVTIQVSESLDVTIGGSGDLYYLGDPDVDANIVGSGEVRRIDG